MVEVALDRRDGAAQAVEMGFDPGEVPGDVGGEGAGPGSSHHTPGLLPVAADGTRDT